MEDSFENMKKLFNAESQKKAATLQKIERSKIDKLKASQKKERERLNQAVKALREERELREIRDDYLEQQKADIMNKHRIFHARKILALPDLISHPEPSKLAGRRRSRNLSSGSKDTVSSEDSDFALTFLKNAELPKVEKTINEATKNKLPPIASKQISFLQVLQNW